MVKSMGLSQATQCFGSSYYNVIQKYLNGQMSEKELEQYLANVVVEKAANSVFSMLEGAISGAFNKTGKAEKDISEHNRVIAEAKERADEISKISDENLREAIKSIDDQTSNIENIIKQAEDIVEKNFNKEQVQIAYLQSQINSNVELLNSEDTKDEDKPAIIEEIATLGGQIVTVSTEINQTISDAIAESQKDALTCSKLITEQIDNSTRTISQNLQNLKSIELSAQVQGTADAATDNATGDAQAAEAAAKQAESAAASATGVAGIAFGAANEAVIADLTSASSVHISGAAANLGELSQSVSNMDNMGVRITSNINLVGQAGTTSEGLIGSFDSIIADIITSTGSLIEDYNASKEALDESLSEYQEANGINTDDSNLVTENDKKGTQSAATYDKDNGKLKVDEDLFTRYEVKPPSFGLS